MIKDRDGALDMASGFCLLIVIYGHIVLRFDTGVNFYALVDICCFYLAFFFFRSGMCYHKKTIKESFLNGWKKLLVPYIVFSCLGILTSLIRRLGSGELFDMLYWEAMDTIGTTAYMGAPMGNLALWFLPSLFCCKLLHNQMISYIDKRVNGGGQFIMRQFGDFYFAVWSERIYDKTLSR